MHFVSKYLSKYAQKIGAFWNDEPRQEICNNKNENYIESKGTQITGEEEEA